MIKLKLAMFLGGLLLIGLGVWAWYYGYAIYKNVVACANYVNDAPAAIDGCTKIIENDSRKTEKDKLFNQGAYRVIWLHLARVHANQNDKEEFEKNSAPYLNGKWPAPVLQLYLGKETPDDLMSQAKSDDVTEQNNQDCEANYYSAEWYLQKYAQDSGLGDKQNKAIEAFQTAKNTCPADFVEHNNAEAELMLLGQ
jgi:lipoprotein NlpI